MTTRNTWATATIDKNDITALWLTITNEFHPKKLEQAKYQANPIVYSSMIKQIQSSRKQC